jgi:hypothetical protein
MPLMEKSLTQNIDRPRRWRLPSILFLVCSIAYGCWYLVSTMPDPDVVDECRAIAASVESKISIPASLSSPGHPALFCDKGIGGVLLRPYDRVSIYGVSVDSQQEAAVDALGQAKQQLKTKPIIVEFYENENWTNWSDPKTGRSGGNRGLETPIRRVIIK